MATSDHTVRLHPETYEALEHEAERRHVAPDELAEELVRGQLPPARRAIRETLDKLAAIRERMPEVDAVQLVRDGRRDLEERGRRWQSS
jgi:predicted transcriptional regulator